MTKPFNIKKPVAFRGKPTERLRVLADDLPGDFPIVVANSKGTVQMNRNDGKISPNGPPDDWDLINIPETRTVWVNFYKYGGATWSSSEEFANADVALNSNPIACAVPVTIEVEE